MTDTAVDAARQPIAPPASLPLPTAVDPRRILWRYAVSIALVHALALLAFIPWFFSWTGLIIATLGIFVFGTLGINLCYHRLLTHHGFVCWKPLEYLFAILGVCCFQDSPARWVAVHRLHHEHSDRQPDPHTPLVSFFWGHVGWMLVENADLNRLGIFERYARDLVRQPFYKWLERSYGYVLFASWIVFFAAGFVAALIMGEALGAAVQFGASVLLWGVVVRTVVVWHITWSVNSLTHMWGYRNYDTDEGSRNNVLVALISNGEGWHNNHHADPRSASHGHRWYEFDVVYIVIRFLALIGAAKHVAKPRYLARMR
jgi:stearoyl-CoA desaturase (delta-9 desaturase)